MNAARSIRCSPKGAAREVICQPVEIILSYLIFLILFYPTVGLFPGRGGKIKIRYKIRLGFSFHSTLRFTRLARRYLILSYLRGPRVYYNDDAALPARHHNCSSTNLPTT